jgi:D-glycero-D-manno-heptose 1,7-bisphosphate phosphatase
MKRPAVFFDRDNTLIACDEYLGDATKVTLVNGAAEAVARARKLGYATVIFSNQSGVARGYFTEEAVHAVNQKLDELLRDGNDKAVIDRHEFCPFHPDASIEKYRQESPLRKPSPGMIQSAADALALDLSRSWVIGDAPRDIEAGHKAGCRTILFTDPNLKSSPAATVERRVEPDYTCTTLNEAMDFVERNTEKPPEVEQPAPSPLVGEGGGEGADVQTPTAAPAAATVARSVPRETSSNESAPSPPHPSPSIPAARDPSSSGEREKASKLESLANEILRELRLRREHPQADFSVSKLMAGVVQVIAVAILFMAFLNRSDNNSLMSLLTFALMLQTMTIALLIMGRQK